MGGRDMGVVKLAGRLWPQKLKYRLIAAVVLFILLPFFLLQIMAYQRIEASLSLEFQEKAGKQLTVMKSELAIVFADMFRYYLFLENDPVTQQALDLGTSMEPGERYRLLSRAAERAGSIRLPSQVAVTMADIEGNVYLSGEEPRGGLDTSFIQDPAFSGLDSGGGYQWLSGEVLRMYAVLKNRAGEAAGYVRMDFLYNSWLVETSRNFLLQQNYQIVDHEGRSLGLSDSRKPIAPALVREIIAGMEGRELNQLLDQEGTAIVSGTFFYDLNWYMLSYLPMNNYLGNMNAIRSQYFYTFLAVSLILVAVTFLIASAISRPLVLLRRKMAQSAEAELKTRVQEGAFAGEMRDLAVTFNTMMNDIQGLLLRLKQEERQKEALHYRMLAAHMNPHFLMNTLNTIKWNVLDKEDTDTADICIALGKLLETTLNSEVELIHLKQELELMHAYMYIQNYRYEGLVAVDYQVDSRLEYALVPKLSLQPLMENALKHGFAHMPEDARVTVRVYARGRKLIMEMEDNGTGLGAGAGDAEDAVREADQNGESLAEAAFLPDKAAAGTDYAGRGKRKGIGLANIEERLRLLFRTEGSLTLEALNRGVMARITLPLLISNPYAEGGGEDVEGAAGGG